MNNRAIEKRARWWRDIRFWITTAVSLFALVIAYDARQKAVTVNVKLDNLIGQEGKVLINTEMNQYKRFLAKAAADVEDSNRVAISRAAYRGFGPGGKVTAKEVDRALKPLRESVEERWFAMNDRIAHLLARMEFKTASVLDVESLGDLHPVYRGIETLKDSVLSLIDETMNKSSR